MRQKKKALKLVGIIMLVLFVLFSMISFVLVKINFDDIFGRTEPSDYTAYLRYENVEDEYERELLSFPSGENLLQGYLYGQNNTKGLVVISHGLGGRAESYFSETLYFVNNGYQVFAYDNTGCYKSEGENSVGLSQSVIDLDAALTYIEGEARFEDLPILLIHGSEDTTVRFDGAGIIAYKEEITNPNIQYMVCDGEKQNDHNQLYHSLASIKYLEELDEAYAKVHDQYEGEVPDEVRAEFFAGINKYKTSELDEDFMSSVLHFYEKSHNK